MTAEEIDNEIKSLIRGFGTMSAVIAHCVKTKIEVQNSIGAYKRTSKAEREAIDKKYSDIILRIAEIMYSPK